MDTWLEAACNDADRRGIPELKPLLEALARSTAALRAAAKGILPDAISSNERNS